MTAIAAPMSDYREEVTLVTAVQKAFANFANFSGRANRGEYWWFVLANVIVSVVLTGIDSAILGLPILSLLWALATLVPGISLSVRRMHDLDKSGWMLLVAFIPVVGAILLIVWFCRQGEPRANRFG